MHSINKIIMSIKGTEEVPHSPSPKTKNRNANLIGLPQGKPLSTPIKYLLQNNIKFSEGKEGDRGDEEIQLISKLLNQSKIFKELDISLEDVQVRKDLCKEIVLIYCEFPHIMDVKDNELYLFFEGQGFQYMQNSLQNQQRKQYKLYQNNEYLMLRKLTSNDYFLALQETNARYHANQKKYQLMVDETTLLGKVSDEIFHKIFYQKIIDRQKQLVTFLKKIEIFNGLPNSFFIQFSKFLIDQTKTQGQKIINRQQKSKYVYFIKQGQIQLRHFSNERTRSPSQTNYYLATSKPYHPQKLGPHKSFGMEHLDLLDTQVDQEASCITDCILYKIQKRLLAIIITSFQLQFQDRNKIWSLVNINNQIKGQNYCSPQKQLLLKNVMRIRTSQKKARDVKLRFFANNKFKKQQQQLQKMSGEKSKKQLFTQQKTQNMIKSRVLSPEQKRRMIKTEDGRFRNTSIVKLFNNFGGLIEQNKYDAVRKQLGLKNNFDHFQDKRLSQIQLITLDEQQKNSSPILRYTNAIQYKEKMQTIKEKRSGSQLQKSSSLHKFVPKLQTNHPKIYNNFNTSNSKYNSDLIGVFLDKKIKNQIVKKAERVLNQNKNLKLVESKHLKRLFSVKQCKLIKGISEQDKKTIASDIVERMSNLKDNPLLLQIESERRKMERQLRAVQRQPKKISDSPRKYKKEDEHILIKNNQE